MEWPVASDKQACAFEIGKRRGVKCFSSPDVRPASQYHSLRDTSFKWFNISWLNDSSHTFHSAWDELVIM